MVNVFTNKQGVSLVELMVGLALMTITLYSFMRMGDISISNNKKMSDDFEVSLLNNQMIRSLSNNNACMNTFGGYADLGSVTTVNQFKDNQDRVLLEIGEKTPSGQIIVNNMLLTNFNADKTKASMQASSLTNETANASAILRIELERTSKKSIGKTKSIKEIPFVFKVDKNFKMVSCAGSINEDYQDVIADARKEVCEELGGNYSNSSGCDLSDSDEIQMTSCDLLGGTYNSATNNCERISTAELEPSRGVQIGSGSCEGTNKNGRMYYENSRLYICMNGSPEEVGLVSDIANSEESTPKPFEVTGDCNMQFLWLPGTDNQQRVNPGKVQLGTSKRYFCGSPYSGAVIVSCTDSGPTVSGVCTQ